MTPVEHVYMTVEDLVFRPVVKFSVDTGRYEFEQRRINIECKDLTHIRPTFSDDDGRATDVGRGTIRLKFRLCQKMTNTDGENNGITKENRKPQRLAPLEV